MTLENDIVLIYFEDKPTTYARVESIKPDVKKDWFILELMILQVPSQKLSWILRESYINGTEFQMDGNRIRLEKVPPAIHPDLKPAEKESNDNGVISFADHKKNR